MRSDNVYAVYGLMLIFAATAYYFMDKIAVALALPSLIRSYLVIGIAVGMTLTRIPPFTPC